MAKRTEKMIYYMAFNLCDMYFDVYQEYFFVLVQKGYIKL